MRTALKISKDDYFGSSRFFYWEVFDLLPVVVVVKLTVKELVVNELVGEFVCLRYWLCSL